MSRTTKDLTDLAEVNRVLTCDLDVSRRILSDLQRERRALLEQIRAANARASLAERTLRDLGAQLQHLGRGASAALPGGPEIPVAIQPTPEPTPARS